MNDTQRKGTLIAAIHILEIEATGTTLADTQPANAIIIALNALSINDQQNISKRIIAYLKEQEMLLNQKP